MKRIEFIKYSLNGNTFVLLEEVNGTVLSESEKSRFAYVSTNPYFGIGADNLIVIQDCSPDVLTGINQERHYWEDLPANGNTDFIFRMFEPSGVEAFSCGNGLLCVADHFNQQHRAESYKVLTQVPTKRPFVNTIGFNSNNRLTYVNMGGPRKPPDSIMKSSMMTPLNGTICEIRNLPVTFYNPLLIPFKRSVALDISGYLVFVGEPHLVIFTQTGISEPEVADAMFVSKNGDSSEGGIESIAQTYSSWIVHFIGSCINRSCVSLFPVGINVNFVRMIENDRTLEYRCFERGIYHETLACGSGAIAASVVARELDMLHKDAIVVRPHRCRWHRPTAGFVVKKDKNDWYLFGTPECLYRGEISFP